MNKFEIGDMVRMKKKSPYDYRHWHPGFVRIVIANDLVGVVKELGSFYVFVEWPEWGHQTMHMNHIDIATKSCPMEALI